MTVDSLCISNSAPSGTIIRLLDHPNFKGTLPGDRNSVPQSAPVPFKNALGKLDHMKRVPAFVLLGQIGTYAVILIDLSLRFLT